MEIPAAPLMAGNQGNQATWWLAIDINTPGSCYRLEGCLSDPWAVARYVLCGVAMYLISQCDVSNWQAAIF